MAATTAQLNALGTDPAFRQRARTLIRQMCAQVYTEPTPPANHAARASFAVRLIQGAGSIEPVIDMLVTRTNIVGSTITFNFDANQVQTDATDAAILSQLATDWDMLAGA